MTKTKQAMGYNFHVSHATPLLTGKNMSFQSLKICAISNNLNRSSCCSFITITASSEQV